MKEQTHLVYYGNKAIAVNCPDLEEVYHDFILDAHERTGKDPDYVQLPNGIKLQYHPYIFHKCFDHNAVSENYLIGVLSISKSQLN